jgi:Raf kinase inhibitor-like YbhB/YbcL family protein
MVRLRKSGMFGLIAGLVVFVAPAGQAMVLSSTNFANGGTLVLPQVNSRCGGQNQSPALSWTGAPANTKSYALTLFDPDAHGGRGFWHWIVFYIPAATAALPAGAGPANGLPAGAVQPENNFGESGYGGACPPPGSGAHHYQFTLYAVGAAKAPFGADAKPAEIVTWLKAHTLATASLLALYQR